MNEIMLFVEIVLFFSLILLIKKTIGKSGLFAWIGIATVLAEIQVTKCVTIFGISATLGNVLFASNFLVTDILRECYSQEDAKKGVLISALGGLFFILFSIITPIFIPNEFDLTHNALKIVLSLTPRITISSILMLIIANYSDVFIYDFLHKKFKGKKMWLRNNISTILCNCLENFFFTFLAFLGMYSISELLMIAVSTCIIETLIALCDTPFLYLAKKISNK